MNIIKRILQDKISERIEPNKAVLLFGARRVGKTVLIRELIKEFKGQSMLLYGEDYDTIALLNERSISNYRHLLEGDRKSTRLNSSHWNKSRMPSSA